MDGNANNPNNSNMQGMNQGGNMMPAGMGQVGMQGGASTGGVVRNGKKIDKRIWMILGVACSVVALILIIVLVGVNSGGGNSEEEYGGVTVNYNPEGAGVNPANSMISEVFSEEVEERLENDNDYSYENAVADYEKAMAENTGQLKLNIQLDYAKFVYAETGDVEAAVSIVRDTLKILGNYYDIDRFYTTVADMYEESGLPSYASYYRSIRDQLLNG